MTPQTSHPLPRILLGICLASFVGSEVAAQVTLMPGPTGDCCGNSPTQIAHELTEPATERSELGIRAIIESELQLDSKETDDLLLGLSFSDATSLPLWEHYLTALAMQDCGRRIDTNMDEPGKNGIEVDLSLTVDGVPSRIAKAGTPLVFKVSAIEKDLWDWELCPGGSFYDDPTASVRITRTDTSPPILIFEGVATAPQIARYTIPYGVSAGTILNFTFELGDRMGESGPRHDAWEHRFSIPIEVVDSCPDIELASQRAIFTASPPAGRSRGGIYAFQSCVGTPPGGRPNWNGYLATEEVSSGILEPFSALAFPSGFNSFPAISGMFVVRGLTEDLGAPGVFLGGDNLFVDTHIIDLPFLVLISGGVAGSVKRSQVYFSGPDCTDYFFITHKVIESDNDTFGFEPDDFNQIYTKKK